MNELLKPPKRPQRMNPVLCFAATLLLLSIAANFWTGCTADLKGGEWGATEQALKVEGMASLLLVIGSTVCGAAVQMRAGMQRPWIGAAIVLGSLAVFGVIGFQSEIWGIQACLPG